MLDELVTGAAGAATVGVPMSLFVWLLRSKLARVEQVRTELLNDIAEQGKTLWELQKCLQEAQTAVAVQKNVLAGIHDRLLVIDRRQESMTQILSDIRLDLKAHIASEQAFI